VLFGLECRTTLTVLDHLHAAGFDIRVVCLPGPPGTAILRAPAARRRFGPPLATASSGNSVASAAASLGLEVWRAGSLRAGETVNAIAALEADLLVVACFNRLIPPAIYEPLPLGGINIHPSLLPDKRGPDPLFWTFKLGDRETGSTVHCLTSRFDAGDILAQARSEVPDGITEDELDECLAALGAGLAVESIAGLRDGRVAGRPQDDAAATWAPHPAPDDFRLDQSGSAKTAFNFMRGVDARGHHFGAVVNGRELVVYQALAWAESEDALPSMSAGQVLIPFVDGVLLVGGVSTDR
jgi:methionyl-tRNA formyltransferase